MAGNLNVSTINGGEIGTKNRIINGGMTIDQRYAGASAVVNDTLLYITDRFFVQDFSSGSLTAQRSTVAPAGFINSLLVTVTATDTSLGATEIVRVAQRIEGLNVADLGWGAANAQAVTLSFWVRSSLTGTFGGAITNNAFNRSYPFTYAISAANTFEYKTITIPGDTTGTWLKDNGIGLDVNFGLGAGSTYSGTAGAWAASGLLSATGAVSVIGTNGATFYITGVQLEKGSVATPFEFRSIGQELGLCQRYFEKSFGYSVAPLNGPNSTTLADAANSYLSAAIYEPNDVGDIGAPIYFKVEKRATPTMTAFGNNIGQWNYRSAPASVWGGVIWRRITESIATPSVNVSSDLVGYLSGHWTASAEL
jgi:hypothetical protein